MGALQKQLKEMGDEGLENALQPRRNNRPYRIIQAIEKAASEGRGCLILEVPRLGPSEPPEAVARRALMLQEAGADCLAVFTDSDDSPCGPEDLAAVAGAVTVPVLSRDWMLHPVQIAEAAAGGAAALTLINCVIGKGLGSMLAFADAAGLDAPVEVCNLAELAAAEAAGAPLFAVNVSVGLSLSLPGVKQSVASSILASLPFGTGSIAGARSVSEAREMRAAGADAVLIRREALEDILVAHIGADPTAAVRDAVGELRYALSGDD